VHIDVNTGPTIPGRPSLFTDRLKRSLEQNGLTADEAEAMYETWKVSYFRTPGFKVFWILPRTLVDELLPIRISPQPKNLERVMVGRSEFLRPSFEQKLLNAQESDALYSFKDDRYIHAYEERVAQLSDPSYSNELASLPELAHGNEWEVNLFPNPTIDVITVEINSVYESPTGPMKLQVIDLNGKIVTNMNMNLVNGYGIQTIDLARLPNGTFFIQMNDGQFTRQFVKSSP
jgi:hypothetical protein